MLRVVCGNCGKSIAVYGDIKDVNNIKIDGKDNEDSIVKDVFCKECYSGHKIEEVKLKIHSLFPIIEKYRFYNRKHEMAEVIKKIGEDVAQNRYGETDIIRCTDGETILFIDGIRERHKEISELVINKVRSEKGATSLGFFMQDITLRATRLKDGRHYLEVLRGVTVIDEYMYFQYNEIRVRV